MKNKKLFITIVVIIFVTFICIIIGGNEDNENSISNNTNMLNTNENITNTIENSQSDELQYYKDNKTINKFINIYNNLYEDNKITSEMLSVYHHHGSDHKDQVQFYLKELQITLTGEYNNKISVFIDNTQNHNSDDILRNLTKIFVKVYNKDITDLQIDEYLNGQGASSDIQTHDGIEYQTSKALNNDIIEYIKLTGNI